MVNVCLQCNYTWYELVKDFPHWKKCVECGAMAFCFGDYRVDEERTWSNAVK